MAPDDAGGNGSASAADGSGAPDEHSEEESLAAAMDAEFDSALNEHAGRRQRVPEPQPDDGLPDDETDSATGANHEAGPEDPAAEAGRQQVQKAYWHAEALIETERSHFDAALADGDVSGERAASYRLAAYHGRTQSILRSALAGGRDRLADAAVHNLGKLASAMHDMHQRSPHAVPVATVLDARGRDLLARDLVMRAISESPIPMDAATIFDRANDLGVVAVKRGTVDRHLVQLVETGHLQRSDERPTRYRHTARTYVKVDLDAQGLASLLPGELLAQVRSAGYNGLSDIAQRPREFAQEFARIARVEQRTAADLTQLVEIVVSGASSDIAPWHHFDLLASRYPRPYQRAAFEAFRGGRYRAKLVESPTGSGKTLIGMLCIQDWLRSMRQGQSILILVPTAAYLQQWTAELCYKDVGLGLSPESVFSGTPGQLEAFQRRTGSHPAVLLMTYTSLAQTGSAVGKGGFDASSIEMFLQGANVAYVILDEVHKVVEDTASISHSVADLAVEWLADGSLKGLIGFSGTAEAYRARFEELRLDLVATIPMDVLVAAGYVAPFAELGVPFSNSRRERRIRGLLDDYKAMMADYLEELGHGRLREWFAEIDADIRLQWGHDVLGMYRGRADWKPALAQRLLGWESGDAIKLTELNVVLIVQLATRRSDARLAADAGMSQQRFDEIMAGFAQLRSQIAELIYLPQTRRRLATPGFGRDLDVDALLEARAGARNQALRSTATKDRLAVTVVGLYESLSDWYRRVGEGRVETIKAVIAAERDARAVAGIIVFDAARRIAWERGRVAPGYEGLGGLYAQMLGDERFTPYAVLSSEQYLPWSDKNPLPKQVARFIEAEMMAGEIAEAMFELATQGLDVPPAIRAELRQTWQERIEEYLPRLRKVRTARPSDFTRRVVRPMRRVLARMDLGSAGERMAGRMDLRSVHFAGLVRTFFDYAIIARYFRYPREAELEQVSGETQRFFVVPMPGGPRKQLMYDLTARLVDAPDLPINLVIVSNWARTGWNVIAPNVLIDATATRDVTAWQQLRGRAIRARRSWTNDCYRLLLVLIGPWLPGLEQLEPDVDGQDEGDEPLQSGPGAAGSLDRALRDLLLAVAPDDLRDAVADGRIDQLGKDQRIRLALALVEKRNKVTHIYELVRSSGSGIQVQLQRPDKVWRRKDAIARKHARELSVDIVSGAKSTGAGHAPLVYRTDPRTDLPEALQQMLADILAGGDDRVARGWLGV